jgi:rubredoxin
MKKTVHYCIACGYVYDGKLRPFEDLPEDYLCPECSSDKDMFEEKEIEK